MIYLTVSENSKFLDSWNISTVSVTDKVFDFDSVQLANDIIISAVEPTVTGNAKDEITAYLL